MAQQLPDLTEGCLRAILTGVNVQQPIVQLLESRLIQSSQTANTPNRYRLLLNDGRNTYSYAMMGTQLNPMVENGTIPPLSIVTLEKFVCNTQSSPQGVEKKVMIVLGMRVEVSGIEVQQKIGNPVALTENGTPAPAGASAGASQQPKQQQPRIGAPPPGQGFGNAKPSFQNQNAPAQNFGGNNFNGNIRTINDQNGPAQKRPNFGSPQRMQQPGAMNQGNGARPSFPPPVRAAAYGSGGNQGPNGFDGGNQSFNSFSRGDNDNEGFGEGETPSAIFPIQSLTPYQHRWTIRARLTSKDPIRNYVNAKGDGKVFGMWFADESDEIKASAFNSEVDKFYDMLEVGKVYYVRGCSVKTPANPLYARNKPYEMTFNQGTLLKLCNDEVEVPALALDLTPIAELPNKLPETIVDVIGICRFVGDATQFTAKQSGKDFIKREIELVDNSNCSVRITLWSATATAFESADNLNQIIAIKGCKVSDFGGRTLSAISQSVIQKNPDIREAHGLRGWYDQVGSLTAAQSISGGGSGAGGATPWKNLVEIQEERLGHGDKPDYFMMKGVIMKINRPENCLYQACPSETCNKKVIDQGNQSYRCEKCNKEYDSFTWRLMLSAEIADFGGNAYVTIFQDQAEFILEKTSVQMGEMRQNDMTSYEKVLNDAQFKSFIFKLRVKMETYNDENRLKYMVQSVEPLNRAEYSMRLVNEINNMNL